MKNKKGFTLIELLAVIIILGVLMIIAVPAVTKYINDSRKTTYVNTAQNAARGVSVLANSDTLGMNDTNTTYYIPASSVKMENGLKSPYGDLTEAYIGVILNDDGYSYYWVSRDSTGTGVRDITPVEKLETENIETGIPANEVTNQIRATGIGNRNNIKILKTDGTWENVSLTDTSNNITEEGKLFSNIVCFKAKTLHNEVCHGSGCSIAIGEGNTITYGTIPGSTPKAGDAYDCDVNNDGVFDSTTERFYYVTKEANNAILIYYKNTGNLVSEAYDSSNENWHGPRTGYLQLPSTSEWSNTKLIVPGTRQIKNELGGNTTTNGTIESFTYEGRAARLLTYQELVSACDSATNTIRDMPGYLDKCNYLLENTSGYNGSSSERIYWLETPSSNRESCVWFTLDHVRLLSSGDADTYVMNGIRPVITVSLDGLE